MKQETQNVQALLTAMFERNNKDVVLAARELAYENRREALIGITDARKLFVLLQEMEEQDSTAAKNVVVQDFERIISRTGIVSNL